MSKETEAFKSWISDTDRLLLTIQLIGPMVGHYYSQMRSRVIEGRRDDCPDFGNDIDKVCIEALDKVFDLAKYRSQGKGGHQEGGSDIGSALVGFMALMGAGLEGFKYMAQKMKDGVKEELAVAELLERSFAKGEPKP